MAYIPNHVVRHTRVFTSFRISNKLIYSEYAARRHTIWNKINFLTVSVSFLAAIGDWNPYKPNRKLPCSTLSPRAPSLNKTNRKIHTHVMRDGIAFLCHSWVSYFGFTNLDLVINYPYYFGGRSLVQNQAAAFIQQIR